MIAKPLIPQNRTSFEMDELQTYIGKSGDIYELPFIGMSNDKAIFKSKSFAEFIAGK